MGFLARFLLIVRGFFKVIKAQQQHNIAKQMILLHLKTKLIVNNFFVHGFIARQRKA